MIIADGAADFPLSDLGDRTPFEAAKTPNLDALARRGRIGTVATTPPGYTAGSDLCNMALLGYDPRVYHTGRAPLEAAALGLDLKPMDWIFRVNLVTVGADEAGGADDGLMLDHSAGAIPNAEARQIVEGLFAFWREREPELMGDMALTPGVSYRNILVDSSAARVGAEPRDYGQLLTMPPHEIPRQPWRDRRPRVTKAGAAGEAAAGVLNRLMELSREYLPTHPVNRERVARGHRPANMVWIWGQGMKPAMPRFQEIFGVRGAMTTAVDLLAGIATIIGWDRLDVPGATSYHDNDYAGQGRTSAEALDDYDLVCCHVESPDECSHQGDGATKVQAIEAIDRHVVGPIVRKLETFGDPEKDPGAEGWRVLVMPDHYTLVSTRKHDNTPPPFVMAGAWIRSAVRRERFIESLAQGSDLHINPGHEVMEYFLRGGLAQVAARVKA